jgi:hypothetical protein
MENTKHKEYFKNVIIDEYNKGLRDADVIAYNTSASLAYTHKVIREYVKEKSDVIQMLQFLFITTDKTIGQLRRKFSVSTTFIKIHTRNLLRKSEIEDMVKRESERGLVDASRGVYNYLFEDVIKEGALLKTEFSDPIFLSRIRQSI